MYVPLASRHSWSGSRTWCGPGCCGGTTGTTVRCWICCWCWIAAGGTGTGCTVVAAASRFKLQLAAWWWWWCTTRWWCRWWWWGAPKLVAPARVVTVGVTFGVRIRLLLLLLGVVVVVVVVDMGRYFRIGMATWRWYCGRGGSWGHTQVQQVRLIFTHEPAFARQARFRGKETSRYCFVKLHTDLYFCVYFRFHIDWEKHCHYHAVRAGVVHFTTRIGSCCCCWERANTCTWW